MSANLSLKYLQTISYNTDQKFNETLFGGISALSYNPQKKMLWALSDDWGNHHFSRLYLFQLKYDSHQKFHLIFKNVLVLKNKNGHPLPVGSIDPEGLIINPDGKILISSEGIFGPLTKAQAQPQLVLFNQQGKMEKSVPFDKRFYLDKEQRFGVRKNMAFEGLTASQDYQNIFVALEESLIQDGPISTQKAGGLPRIIHFKKVGNDYKRMSEYVYPLEPLGTHIQKKDIKGLNGITELLSYSNKELIVLERSYIKKLRQNEIKLFIIDLKSGTNVIHIPSLKNYDKNQVKFFHKKLLLDLNFLAKKHPQQTILDNMEGLCFGPTLPNGNRTLIMASDNNFNKHQKTLFHFFEIKEKNN